MTRGNDSTIRNDINIYQLLDNPSMITRFRKLTNGRVIDRQTTKPNS